MIKLPTAHDKYSAQTFLRKVATEAKIFMFLSVVPQDLRFFILKFHNTQIYPSVSRLFNENIIMRMTQLQKFYTHNDNGTIIDLLYL